jgi:hypothetical protein
MVKLSQVLRAVKHPTPKSISASAAVYRDSVAQAAVAAFFFP